MSDDLIEKTIGRFGKYQSLVVFLITLGRFPAEFQLNNVVFILPKLNYICLDDDAYNITNHCPCESPQYIQEDVISSVTSEWNLICGRTALASLSQSMLQFGILPGSLIFGYISDRHGRRPAVCLSLLLSSIFATLSAAVPKLWMFMALRFLIGATIGGTMLCGYVIMIELCGSTFRNYVVVLNGLALILGSFFLPIIAFYVREWRYLQLATGAPWLFVIVYFWLIPESPIWLITVGRKKEGIDCLTYIAKRNGLPTQNIESLVSETAKEAKGDEEQNYGTYFDLFSTPKLRVYSILNAIIWMLCAHTFYGVNQYIGRLQGNLYLNVILSALCLVPGMTFVILSITWLTRKNSIILSFLIAAASLLMFLVIPSNSLTLPFALLGFVGIYSAFVLIYLYSSEIFPTIVRNSAMGFASMFGRVGSIIAPFVVNIGVEWATIVIFSASAFCAAMFCYFLPETKNIVLLNTVEQTEKMGTGKSNRREQIS